MFVFQGPSLPNDYIGHGMLVNVTWTDLATCARPTRFSVALHSAVQQRQASVSDNPTAEENQCTDQSRVLPFLFLQKMHVEIVIVDC